MTQRDDPRSRSVRGYQSGLVVVIALIVSLAGGAVSSRLFAAQQPQPAGSNNAGELIVPPDGLLFKSPEGKVVAKLSLESEGGHFTVYNSKGTSVAAVYSSDGGGVLGIFNSHGVPKLMLFANEDSGYLGLYSKYGKLAIAMSGFEGGGNIGINSPSGDSALTLEADSKSGKLQITKPDGRLIWSAP